MVRHVHKIVKGPSLQNADTSLPYVPNDTRIIRRRPLRWTVCDVKTFRKNTALLPKNATPETAKCH